MTASKSILIRVTPQEHAEIVLRAQQSGQSLSRFLVAQALADGGISAPMQEVKRAREALQAALRALDDVRDHQPCEVVQEGAISPAIVAAPAPALVEVAPVVQAPQLAAPVQEAPAPKTAPVLPPTVIQDLVSTRYQPDWIKAVRSIYRNGNTSHAITQPELLPTYLKVDKQYRIRRGTMIVAAVGDTLYVGWTRDGRVEWDEATRYDWDTRKATTIDRLCVELQAGPPWRRAKAVEPAPEPVSTVEVRPLTPAEKAVAAELDEALATTTTTTNPFDNA